MRKTLAAACAALALLAAAPAAAQQQGFDEAVAAYDRGDFAEAVRIWTPLARRGDVAAQFNLGLMYEKGRGVPADAQRAAQWYQSAGESGHAKSAFNLGLLHSRGALGPERNLDEAGKWLEVAAEKGIPQAQYLYGMLLADPAYKGLNPNLSDQWMRRAADAGYAPARAHIAAKPGQQPPAPSAPASSAPAPVAAVPPAPPPRPTQAARPAPEPPPARPAPSVSAETAETRPALPIPPGRGRAATAPAAATEPALSVAVDPTPGAAMRDAAPPPEPQPPRPEAIAPPPPEPAPPRPAVAAAPPPPRPAPPPATRPSPPADSGWRMIFSSRDPGFRGPEGERLPTERRGAPEIAPPQQLAAPAPRPTPPAAPPPRAATPAPMAPPQPAPPPVALAPPPVAAPSLTERPTTAMASPQRPRPGYVPLQTEISDTYRPPAGGPRNYRVWLGVTENETQARWEWERLVDRHPQRLVAVAADAELVVSDRNMPSWRIYAGRFETMAAASAFCAELRMDDRASRCIPYHEPP